jgi:hypothetical protein
MKIIGSLLDRILLALVARRLRQCESRGDSADLFADDITAALQVEMARRGRLLDEDELRRHRERHKKFE